jgi:hypothetical protein
MLKNMQKFKKNHGFLTDFLLDFWEKSNVFQHSFDDISAICTVEDFVQKAELIVKNRFLRDPKTNWWNR